MAKVVLPKSIKKLIDSLVLDYKSKKADFENRAKTVYNLLNNHPLLKDLVHSTKYRSKDVSHFKLKLIRKYLSCKENVIPFDIDKKNVYDKITDLAGVRILHINRNQIIQIDKALKEIFKKESYSILEGPSAHTWDADYKKFYEKLDFNIVEKDSMYTSVHYIISVTNSESEKCELQVRTLMEEVWGEVSHKIDYPVETKCKSCKSQINVLARITSSGIRLVDSIFESLEEYNKKKRK